jgi:hypothetical protein
MAAHEFCGRIHFLNLTTQSRHTEQKNKIGQSFVSAAIVSTYPVFLQLSSHRHPQTVLPVRSVDILQV